MRSKDAAQPVVVAPVEDVPIPPEARKYWAFQKPARRPIPVNRWNRHPIDAFLMDSMQAHSLEPAPEADPRTLVRRAYWIFSACHPRPRKLPPFLTTVQLTAGNG